MQISLFTFQKNYFIITSKNTKYDKIQKEYRTLLHDQFTVFSILVTIEDTRFEEMCAVVEAMASVSHKVVRPAYNETTLRTKIAKDPGIISVKSLNYFHNPFCETMGTNENTVISRNKAVEKSTKSAVKAINGKLDRVIKKQEG